MSTEVLIQFKFINTFLLEFHCLTWLYFFAGNYINETTTIKKKMSILALKHNYRLLQKQEQKKYMFKSLLI